MHWCNEKNKQWLPIVTYEWSDVGCSGSGESVLNHLFEKGNEK